MDFRSNRASTILCGATSGLALTLAMLAAPAAAQVTPPAATPASPQAPASDTPQSDTPTGTPSPDLPGSESEIVVTGFRASLNSAINLKRNETAAIDSIVSEDIGKFPDSNLAESMQRIPGVALARGDGGEGRNISVRGLGAQFTRVRINGLEGASQTGASDIQGAANNGRSFDFNTFPSEIFSSLAVRKTTSADVEEGSLGATVDLRAPHPLDQRQDFVVTATGRGIWNQISKKVDPRFSGLVSKKFADGTFGVLASAAYQKRHLREVGYSAVDILSANTNGLAQSVNGQSVVFPFCTPVGYTLNGTAVNSPVIGFRQNAANPASAIGATATDCSTGNPRTSTLAAFNTIFNLRRSDLPNVPGSGAFLPRIPRYVNSEQDTSRIGGSLSLQWQPTPDTDISLDGLYSRFKVERRDNYIAGLSFGRSITNLGQPAVSVREAQFDSLGSLVYGVFDGVDLRSEGLVDRFTTTFKQANLNFRHRFSDSFQIDGMIGGSKSVLDNYLRFQTFIDAIDADGFTLDFRNGRSTPLISYGIDVANPANFAYAASRPDGTVLGGFDFQGRPAKNKTTNKTGELNATFNVAPGFAFKFGGQYRENDFRSFTTRPVQGTVNTGLPAGTTLASITRQITGLDDLFGGGAPGSWAAIDPDKWASTFNLASRTFCAEECGGGRSQIRERIKSGYLMVTFDTKDMLPIPIRGDAGVRYVNTEQRAVGYIPIAAVPASSSPTGLVGQRAQVDRSYEDWLPSVNVVLEFTPKLLGRLATASVLSRAELGSLTPSSSITATTRTGSVNNPFLDPIRADTYDLALEWYFQPGSLLSFAYYHKDIKTYIQSVTSQVPFNQLGLPDALLNNTNTAPSEIFSISRPTNTRGGPLKGFEVNAQVQLSFLPGFLSNFGVLGNYNRVTSKITYVLASVNGVPTVTTTADLVGLSKNTASGTLYYDDGKFSIRTTANYRDRYIRAIPASAGSDVRGNASNIFVDASASYNVTDNIKLIVEAQNLTDERNTLYIDNRRQDTLFETRLGRTFNVGATVKF